MTSASLMTDAKRIAVQSRSPLRTARGRTSRRCGCPPGTRHSTPAHTRAHEAKDSSHEDRRGVRSRRVPPQGARQGRARGAGHEVVDVGPDTARVGRLPAASRPTPRVWSPPARSSARVLACGSGVGVAIVANKVAGVRAVNAHDAVRGRDGAPPQRRQRRDARRARGSARSQADAIVAAFLRDGVRGRPPRPPRRADHRPSRPSAAEPDTARPLHRPRVAATVRHSINDPLRNDRFLQPPAGRCRPRGRRGDRPRARTPAAHAGDDRQRELRARRRCSRRRAAC